jgi:hypothetical protein
MVGVIGTIVVFMMFYSAWELLRELEKGWEQDRLIRELERQEARQRVLNRSRSNFIPEDLTKLGYTEKYNEAYQNAFNSYCEYLYERGFNNGEIEEQMKMFSETVKTKLS